MSISKSILAVALFTAVTASQAYVVTAAGYRGGDQSFDAGSQGHGGDDFRLPQGDDRFGDDHGHHDPHGGMTPAVPEPGTVLLMAAGLGAIGWIARRRPARND